MHETLAFEAVDVAVTASWIPVWPSWIVDPVAVVIRVWFLDTVAVKDDAIVVWFRDTVVVRDVAVLVRFMDLVDVAIVVWFVGLMTFCVK